MTPRRDLTLAGVAVVVLLGMLPAYGRVFAAADWRAPALAAGLLAVLLAAAARRLRAGAVLTVVVSLIGLALFTYVAHLPPDGLLPGPQQARDTAALIADGIEQLRLEPVPAEPLAGLVLLVTTGFWLCGFLVHELLVRWRRPGLAMIPAVVLWTVPLAVPQPDASRAPVALAFLAAVGLALLLGADAESTLGDRLPSPSAPGLATAALALAVALLAPGILPGYGAEAWIELGAGRDPQGYQPIVDVTDRLQLPEERDVLRVESTHRTYLRLAGLDAFDGGTWRLGEPGEASYQPDPEHLYDTRGELPPESPARSTTQVQASVEVLALENIYVPVPYQPRQIEGPGSEEMVWSTEGGFLATWATAGEDDETPGAGSTGVGTPRVGVRPGLSYEVTAQRPTPTAEELREAEASGVERATRTRLPTDYPELREQAEAVYAQAEATTDVDRALALQDWFVGADSAFTYDLDVDPLRDDDALRAFVLEDRVGYCEYFATAMAVMLRATDVPARVAVGFLPGRVTEQPDEEEGETRTEYTVSSSDAHAWVEVWFPDHGWVAFEPTPRDDQAQMVPEEGNLAPWQSERQQQQDEQDEQDDETSEPERDPATGEVPLPNLPEGGGAQDGEGLGDAATRGPLVALAALLLLAAALAIGRVRRREASLPPGDEGRAVAAQRSLLATAARYGLARRPSETLRETVGRWRAAGRVDERADRLVTLTSAAAFGGAVSSAQAQEAERIAGDLATMLRSTATGRERLLAPVRVPLDELRDRARTLATFLPRPRRRA